MVYVYALTSVLSAFLVFFIQPVIAKIALPTLGGTPAVWNGCMVFFQALLLAGYVYAHLLSQHVRLKWQPVIHLSVLLLAVSTFPMTFDGGDGVDPALYPLQWLMAMLFFSVGLPYFVITASSPLLQRWFSHSGHKDASNPYFLYAASNVGSMGALLSYPIIIEPLIGLSQQAALWQWGVGILLLMMVCVSSGVLKGRVEKVSSEEELETPKSGNVNGARRFYWVALAFVPSSLLYGVTSYITTDVASAPFIWVVPLSLYLMTFIFVFERKLWGFELCRKLHLFAVMILFVLLSMPGFSVTVIFILHLVGFYIVTMTLHGLLSKSKPDPSHLTEFFLLMSLGGVLGGIFNTFIAPTIFNDVVEYPLALALSCVLGMYPFKNADGEIKRYVIRSALWGALALLAAYGMYRVAEQWGDDSVLDVIKVGLITLGVAIVSFTYLHFKSKPYVLSLALMFFWAVSAYVVEGGSIIYQTRNVFGVHKVRIDEEVNVYKHGTTLHGIQVRKLDGNSLEPTSYFTDFEVVFDKVYHAFPDKPIAVLGLGIGTLICYGREDQVFDIYEIDPVVVKIASNAEYFTFMRDCPPEKNVVLGDARLGMSRSADNNYGMVIVDTFSSDSIPVHLMTKEAIELYLSKLSDGGVLLLHISNRHIDLRPVLAGISKELNVFAMQRGAVGEDNRHSNPSSWVMISRDTELLREIEAVKSTQWTQLDAFPTQQVWKDDFTNIFMNLKFIQKIIH